MNGTGNFKEDDQLLLKRFREIDPREPRSIVAYYEENSNKIAALSEKAQCHIHRSYVTALFDLGDHEKYAERCTDYISRLFETPHQIVNWRADLAECLYKKAYSENHLGNLPAATRTLEELIRLDPEYPGLARLSTRVLIHQKIDLLQGISAVTIFTTLLAAFVIAIELFFIRPFRPEWIIAAEYLRIGLFSFSIVHFFVAHALLRWWMLRVTENKLSEARILRKQKESAVRP